MNELSLLLFMLPFYHTHTLITLKSISFVYVKILRITLLSIEQNLKQMRSDNEYIIKYDFEILFFKKNVIFGMLVFMNRKEVILS